MGKFFQTPGPWVYPMLVVFTEGEEIVFKFATQAARDAEIVRFRKRRDVVRVEALEPAANH